MLIIVMGLPGSGKTFFATALTKEMQALHMNTDGIRKEVFPKPMYSPKEKVVVYETLFDRVCSGLLQGKNVIIDATFSKELYRKPYSDFAKDNNIPCHIILIEASKSTIAERLKKERQDSDADFKVYKEIAEEFEEIDTKHLQLQSDVLSLSEMINTALDFIHFRKIDV